MAGAETEAKAATVGMAVEAVMVARAREGMMVHRDRTEVGVLAYQLYSSLSALLDCLQHSIESTDAFLFRTRRTWRRWWQRR